METVGPWWRCVLLSDILVCSSSFFLKYLVSFCLRVDKSNNVQVKNDNISLHVFLWHNRNSGCQLLLTGAGGAALLRVDFGILAVDDTLHICLGDDTFLSQPGRKSCASFKKRWFIHRYFLCQAFLFTLSSFSLLNSILNFLSPFIPTLPLFVDP